MPKTPVAAQPPLVVFAHGSTTASAMCAPSQNDVTMTTDSGLSQALAMAAYGYPVIAPDYAGFGYGATPGWLLSVDEGHSVLDGSRALRKLLASSPLGMNQKVALVGHSQGGHAVLSAHAIAKTYGLGGTLAAVVPMAPFWLAGRAWGAAITPLAMFTTQMNAAELTYAVLYFYTHGEVYDGPGGGVTMFQPAKQQLVKTIMTTMCLDQARTALPQLGNVANDFFTSTFASEVGNCAALDSGCTAGTAASWKPRFVSDRPSVDPMGAPITIWQGGMDGAVTPDRAQCGFDKIKQDLMVPGATTQMKVCADKMADHTGVVQRNMDWVNQWINQQTLGGPAPTATCGPQSDLMGAMGAPVCPSLPPNQD